MKNLEKNTLMEKMDDIKDLLGTELLLQDLAQSLDSHELQSSLEYINRCYDLNIFNDSEEK